MSFFDNKRGVSTIAIVLIVVVLAATGVVGGAYIANKTGMGGPLASLGQKLGMKASPQLALKNAYQKTAQASSMDVNGQVEVDGTDTEEQTPINMTLSGTMEGVSQSQENGQVSSQGTIQVSGEMEGQPANITIDYRTIPPKRYIRLSSAELGQGMGAMFGGFMNQWIVTEIEGENPLTSQLEGQLEVSGDCQNEEAIREYMEDFDPSKLIEGVEAAGEAEISGETVTRYDIVIDRQAVIDTSKELEEIGNCSDEEVQESDIPTFEAFQVFVGQDTGYIRGVEMTADISSETFEGTIRVGVELSNFNQPPEVEEPENAKTMEELMGSMFDFGGMMDGGSLEDMEAGAQGSGSVQGGFDPEQLEQLQEQMEGMQLGQ